jgi:hypothetical protein
MESELLKGLNNQMQKPLDNIPAKLTENEYVIPADVVLILGNGDPKAGEQALDSFVEKVRQSVGK